MVAQSEGATLNLKVCGRMLCEVVVHGNRQFMPFPEFSKVVDGKTVQVEQEGFPYKCLRRAHLFRVYGQSFSCMATLCKRHKRAAVREGFTLEEIEEPQL